MRRIQPTPATVHWGYFDAALPPIATIEPGETFILGSVSGSRAECPDRSRFTVRAELDAIHATVRQELGPHILTGPIAVRGAEPGDALRVDILGVDLADDWAFNIIKPGLGALPDDFKYERCVHMAIDRQTGRITTPWGMQFSARPFFGVMGTAPDESLGRLTSVVPGSFGGNIDNKELGAGASLYLPVAVEGALFSAGDGHGAQGDGECCLTAVETGLLGTFRIGLIKQAHLDAPFAETATHLITMAFEESLDEALPVALRRMIRMITQRTTIDDEAAYRLCSIAADIRITQVVNRKKGVHVMLPLDLIRA